MTTDEGIIYDRTLLDKEKHIGTFEVSRQMIIDFAKSTGETNPMHLGNSDGTGDIIAPATICNIFVNGLTRPDIKLEFGDLSFFAGQSIECKKEIKPGDVLGASTKLHNVYSKRDGLAKWYLWFGKQLLKIRTMTLSLSSMNHSSEGIDPTNEF